MSRHRCPKRPRSLHCLTHPLHPHILRRLQIHKCPFHYQTSRSPHAPRLSNYPTLNISPHGCLMLSGVLNWSSARKNISLLLKCGLSTKHYLVIRTTRVKIDLRINPALSRFMIGCKDTVCGTKRRPWISHQSSVHYGKWGGRCCNQNGVLSIVCL